MNVLLTCSSPARSRDPVADPLGLLTLAAQLHALVPNTVPQTWWDRLVYVAKPAPHSCLLQSAVQFVEFRQYAAAADVLRSLEANPAERDLLPVDHPDTYLSRVLKHLDWLADRYPRTLEG